VPAIYPFVFFLADGGLVAYGTDVKDLFRRAASYVDRVLRGEKPANLPVQAPVKFELAVNLKTARAESPDPSGQQRRAPAVIDVPACSLRHIGM
jgi:ABC transporter substrate binding protein